MLSKIISMIAALALVAGCGVAGEQVTTVAPAPEPVAELSAITQKAQKIIADTRIRQEGALKGHVLKPWPSEGGLWRYANFALSAIGLRRK